MPGPAPDSSPEYLLPQSVIPRAAAYLIDSFIAALITMALAAAGVIDGVTLERLDQAALRDLLESNSGITITIILFAYFLVCEGLWGRTPGKLALGLRVVRVQDGSPCGWSRSLVRNCIRPFDLLFLGLPGGVVVLMTPARQRLGDLLGGTLVVRSLRVPAEMAAVIPRLLRRCPDCGRLAGASAACPGCSAPPPVTPEAARRQFGAAVIQPFAGMMAAGEAAAALRVAAQAALEAEVAYADASAAENARLQGEGPVASTAAAAEDVASAPGDPVAESGPAADPFVHTDDAPGLSDEYVAAWRGLMEAVDTLRARRADLDAKMATAKVPLGQVLSSDPVLRGLLDEVGPYLDAEDDEEVLAAFMARVSGETATPAPAASPTPAASPPPDAPPAPRR